MAGEIAINDKTARVTNLNLLNAVMMHRVEWPMNNSTEYISRCCEFVCRVAISIRSESMNRSKTHIRRSNPERTARIVTPLL